MSANTEQKVSASIITHQEGKKELAARMEVETYRVFSIYSTKLREKKNRNKNKLWVYLSLFEVSDILAT